MQVDNEVQNQMVDQTNQQEANYPWTFFVDRSSTTDGFGVGIMLKSPEGTIIEQAIRLGSISSNNESEYEALVIGLKKAKLLGVQHLVIHYQLTGKYTARNQTMEAYMRLAQISVYIERFPRTNNSHVDSLATLASAVGFEKKRTIEVEFLPITQD